MGAPHEAELDSYRVHPFMLDRIESPRSRLGTSRAAFRILDFGCGRGKLVLWLREHGHDAVGVELDPRPFEFGARRQQLIAAYVLLGVEPYWSPRDAKPRRERVAESYDYSVRETFYRPPAVLRSAFRDGGFDTSLVDLEAERKLRTRLARIGLGPSSPLIRAWATTFGNNVGLATRLSKAS